MKKRIITVTLLLAMLFLFGLPVSAEKMPYTTYTYSYSGEYQVSPDAFSVIKTVQNIEIADGVVLNESQRSSNDTENYVTLNDAYDMVSDSKGNIYIADTGNNRILILNSDYQVEKIINSYSNGIEQIYVNAPQGVFIDDSDQLYIVDTGNGNIVKYNTDLSIDKIVTPPLSKVLPDDFTYTPTAVAVDKYGRFYVICSGTNDGVITFDQDGVFEGFIGATKVIVDPVEKLWRSIMSEEQLAQLVDSVPSSYNNVTVDKDGFIYVTCSSIDAYTLKQIVNNRTMSSTYMPIKKLNPSGTDVLKRNGFFAPVGEISFDGYSSIGGNNPSALSEIVVLDNDVYSVVDSENNKIFTYDEYGNLLYAFGTTGTIDGTFDLLQAIAYQSDDTLIALDRKRNSITVFQKTEYGSMIDEVIELQHDRKFSQTIEVWEKILKINNNYDLAYLGVGKSLMQNGEYKQAMEYFKTINNKEYYNKAFEKYRSGILEKSAIFIPVVIVLLLWLVVKFFSFAKRYNTSHRLLKVGYDKHTITEEVMYGFYVMFHPFDGFWDLKKEKRGSVRGATVWLLFVALAMICNKFLCSYLLKGGSAAETESIFSVIENLLIPLLLWCVVNWCLTALMDGKGKGSDIYVYTVYALVPLTLMMIPASLISNLLTSDEMIFVTYAINFGYIWSGFLIFFGCMVTHDYTPGKNVFVCILTIAGMVILLFLAFLFIYVLGRTASFIDNIFTEISFRL